MSMPSGTRKLGPEDGVLAVRTGRTGAAAKAGHDLLLHVTAWQARLELGAGSRPTSLALEADATSLRVREGTGGLQALGEDDKQSIEQSIDEEVLKRQDIVFRSTSVQSTSDDRLSVEGELTLVGTARPISFELAVGGDGKLSGNAVIKQSEWGIKPYSTLFGALKVEDEVEVTFEARPAD